MTLKPLIAATVAATVIAGGAFASAAVGFFSPARDDAVQLVPSAAFIYGNVFLDPSAPQKLALQDLIARFPKASTPEQAKAAIVDLLNKGLAEIGMEFSADIEPWLGSQVAFFMMPPNVAPAAPGSAPVDPGAAILIASDDPDATQAAVDKAIAADAANGAAPTNPASYNGVDYMVSSDGQNAIGVIDNFLVFGSDGGIKAVADARGGESLAESKAYVDATASLTEDRIATLYLDPSKAFAGLPPGVVPPALGNTAPLVSILYVRSDAVVFEGSSSASAITDPFLDAGSSDLLDRLPGDTWAAFGIPSAGPTIRQAITQIMSAVPGAQGATGAQLLEGQFEMQFGLSLEKDLLSWLGDIAFFAQGNAVSSFGGGAVIQATDPKAAAAAMPKIKAALERAGAPVVPLDLGQFEGFSIQDKGMAEPINFVLADQRVLIVFGDNATLAALGSDPALASDANFTAARDGLGDGFSVAGYLDMARAVSIIDSEIPTDPAYDNDVKPFLEHLSYAVFGSKREGDRLLTRAVIGVK